MPEKTVESTANHELARSSATVGAEKIDTPKVQIDHPPQVFGLAKEVKPVVKLDEKLGENSSAIAENEKPSRSTDSESDDSEEEEDVRQLEGRTVSAKGQEVKLFGRILNKSIFFRFSRLIGRVRRMLGGRKKRLVRIQRRKMILDIR